VKLKIIENARLSQINLPSIMTACPCHGRFISDNGQWAAGARTRIDVARPALLSGALSTDSWAWGLEENRV
jgi:hypothetical protein